VQTLHAAASARMLPIEESRVCPVNFLIASWLGQRCISIIPAEATGEPLTVHRAEGALYRIGKAPTSREPSLPRIIRGWVNLRHLAMVW
jgi:hypothetical protein